MKVRHLLAACALVAAAALPAQAQTFAPGQFAIDGIPLACGPYPTVVTGQMSDSGMFNGQAIFLNPVALGRMPTALKLFVYAHECGHAVVGGNEMAADCWAVRLGRDQGWFPPQAFGMLMQMFAGNPGSVRHPPGVTRVQNMWQCYQS